MENNLQLDLATLALKGKRYQEAESVYMQIATQNNAPEAWVGLGVCKLYQLSEGRTMDEIIFCFNKAFQILPEEKRDIEIQLLSNATIVLQTYAKIIENAAIKHQQAKKAAQSARLFYWIGGA